MKRYNPGDTSDSEGRWTLLFVNGKGKTKQIKWFKSLFFFYLFLLTVMAGCAVTSYLLYHSLRIENTHLKSKLNLTTKLLNQVKAENKLIMARNMISHPQLRVTGNEDKKTDYERLPFPREKGKNTVEPEVKMETMSSKPELKTVDEKIDSDTDGQMPARSDTDDDAESTGGDKAFDDSFAPQDFPQHAEKSDDRDPDQKTLENPTEDTRDQDKKKEPQKTPISAEDFVFSHDPDHQVLAVHFNIKNVDPDTDRVSGHAIVVLKPDNKNQNQWLVIPGMELVDGKPTGNKTGFTFSIARFKSMIFKAQNQPNLRKYKTATVFIFSRKGELLLEKNVPVAVN